MHTTHDDIAEPALQRTVGFIDAPGEFTVWVEWRMPVSDDHRESCPVCQQDGMPQPEHGLVLVRRDAHVIKKDAPSAVGEAGRAG